MPKEKPKRKKIQRAEKRLRQLAAEGKVLEIARLVVSTPGIDINATGPKSGRTAMHWAAAKKHFQVFELLAQLGGNRLLKDKAEFTPIDLLINPIPEYHGEGHSLKRKPRKKLIENLQPLLLESDLPIHYAVSVTEMLEIIESNPSQAKIGFVVETPNVLKFSTDNSHVIPIVFIRESEGREAFIILDSAYVKLTPIFAKDGVEREVFFTPFPRQASDKGCFREAILVLIHALLDASLLDFARENSSRVTEITREISEIEHASLLNPNLTTIDSYINQARVLARLNFTKVSQSALKMSLVRDVHIITLPPLWLFRFVENFRTLRLFKSHPKVKNHLSLVARHAEQLDIAFLSRSSGLALTAEERSRCACSTRTEDDFNLYRHKRYAANPVLAADIASAKRLFNLITVTNGCGAAAASGCSVTVIPPKLSQAKYSLFIPSEIASPSTDTPSLEEDEISALLHQADVCLFAVRNGFSVAHCLAEDEEHLMLTMK